MDDDDLRIRGITRRNLQTGQAWWVVALALSAGVLVLGLIIGWLWARGL